MHPTNFTYFLILYIVLYIFSRIGLFLLFKKAKVNLPWLAFIPIACYWPWIKLTGRPKTWIFWSLIPAADVIIWFSLVIDILESFGKFTFKEQVIGVLFPFYYYPKMAMDKQVVYLGKSRDEAFRKKFIVRKKGGGREWADAIFFAFVVAYIIRTFQLEPYKIPTSSMEDSMLVGDFLFVSKMNYGPRFPITPIAFPLVHQEFVKGVQAYSEAIKLPYMRLPGFQDVKRNDPIVFNVPIDAFDPIERPVDKMQNYVKRCVGVPGDKLEVKDGDLFINDQLAFQSPNLQHFYFIMFEGEAPSADDLTKKYDIYDFEIVNSTTLRMAVDKETISKIGESYKIISVLQDKYPKGKVYYQLSQNEYDKYIMYFRDNSTFINNIKVDLITIEEKLRKQYNAVLTVKKGQTLADKDFKTLGIFHYLPLTKNFDSFYVFMDDKNFSTEKYSIVPKIESITPKYIEANTGCFPQSSDNYFNKDNYGPIYLPKRGEKVSINKTNFYFYEQAIKVYEGNETFELNGSTPYLDGKEISNYTFKYDYYWMMGDNRDNSSDSRFFGYVPETHIVGKPLFVFFSIQYKKKFPDQQSDEQEMVKVRWNRLFRSIK